MTSLAAPAASSNSSRGFLPTPQQRKALVRNNKKNTASTPNLNSVYAAHSRLAPSAAAAAPALTLGSLASIPDDSESYAFNSVLNDDPDHPPTTATADHQNAAGSRSNHHNHLDPGPAIQRPNTALSTRRMGPVTPGRGGDDVGVGDVVDVPGAMYGTVRFLGPVAGRKGTFAGVELHPDFAGRGKNNGDVDGVSYFTTLTPGAGIFVPISKLFKRATTFAHSPTHNSLAAMRSQSRNASNTTTPTPSLPKFSQSVGPGRAASPGGKRPRVSLARPESPVRKMQLSPAPRPALATPAANPQGGPRYGSPSMGKFSASVRGTSGDPNKRPERKASVSHRSASALGQVATNYSDEEITPGGRHTASNGSMGSMSSLKFRPASRATAAANEEEVERLRAHLEDRERQLRDQASALAEMESSVAELTALMEGGDFGMSRANNLDGKDTTQLRALLKEKNEKIAMLTAEFDAHRADFRSTIDTLEMASTETQRVYDAKINEMEQEIQDMQERAEDVESVARQLKQLEELVQELEEGLEDARRGEAEARGEVEFLRGEVERTRTELRREREKASASINSGSAESGDASALSKELEKKEDEIRGLKAIIHSLSRDAPPGNDNESLDNASPQPPNSESIEDRVAREQMERELNELRAMVESKSSREEELEREVESLRRSNVTNITSAQRESLATVRNADRPAYHESEGSIAEADEAREPVHKHKRVATLDKLPESDAYSSVTESSTLWCEICETAGHDILTCTNMFGPQQTRSAGSSVPSAAEDEEDQEGHEGQGETRHLNVPNTDEAIMPRPLTPARSAPAPTAPPAKVNVLPNPSDSGPLAGKDSGVIDPEKWCALCERDGHESIDCPLEDGF